MLWILFPPARMWPVVGWILLDGLVADGGVGIPISMIHQRTVSHGTLCHTVLCVTQYCVTQCCVTQYSVAHIQNWSAAFQPCDVLKTLLYCKHALKDAVTLCCVKQHRTSQQNVQNFETEFWLPPFPTTTVTTSTTLSPTTALTTTMLPTTSTRSTIPNTMSHPFCLPSVPVAAIWLPTILR